MLKTLHTCYTEQDSNSQIVIAYTFVSSSTGLYSSSLCTSSETIFFFIFTRKPSSAIGDLITPHNKFKSPSVCFIVLHTGVTKFWRDFFVL
jgi:hypothetical protein